MISLLLVSFSFAGGFDSFWYTNSEGGISSISAPKPVKTVRRVSSYQTLKGKYLGTQLINEILSQDVLDLKGRVRELKDKVKGFKPVEVEKEVLPWWLVPAFIVALLI